MTDWPPAPPTAPPAPTGLQVGGAAYPTRPPEQWPAHAPLGPPPPGAGPPAAGPTPPDDDRSNRAGPVVAAAIAVVALLALTIVGVGTLATSGDDDDQATDTTVDLSDPEITAPPSEEPIFPTMPTLPGLDPGSGVDPAERAQPLETVLPDLIAFVEETRGQQFVTDPVVEPLDAAAFERRFAETEDEGEAMLEIAPTTVAGVPLGLLPPDFDLERAVGDLLATSVLGFYDPETEELVVKGDQVTPFVQYVIVHELTHSLDDQIFDLGRLDELATRDDESAFAFLNLVEGTANHVASAFRDQLGPEDAEAFDAEQYALGLDQLPAAMGFPPSLLVQSQVPYAAGERFVDALVAEGGMAEVDTAYGEPPTTTEQILEPDVFLAGEGAVELRPLETPAGVEADARGAFGAADLRLLDLAWDPTAALIDPDLGALDPVPGYGGGQYVTWTEGGRSCVALEAVGDDAAGSAAIEESLRTWAGVVPGAEISSRVGGSGIDVITATSCV